MVESVRLKLNTVHNPGPGFMPFYLGFSLAVLSVLAFFFPESRKETLALWKGWKSGASTFYIFAALMIYVSLLKILGFYLDTFLIIFFLLKVSGEPGYKNPFFISLFTMAITYALFYKLLYIPFTRGIFGI